ncbi:hypothetical protein ADK55_29110 [Streptomyces sp. WM4235]|uniref:hypothetical protein n=1 Tax=Streptomyces sp. WM4235 TaxID=1415551 RepID=UPI0006AF85E0|nr:hypothetical protein [Streptomyces sp. WM4235]KOU41253.1 hypothetical protein ADK55_29110 [Streptomyces sp. WM4235]
MTARTAKTTPDDQPFDFNLDTVESEVALDPFRVHFQGRRWEFAHIEGLDIWDLVEAAEGGQLKAMIGVFQNSLGDQWPEFRKLSFPQYKMKALFTAYRKHCGLEPGESEASGS